MRSPGKRRGLERALRIAALLSLAGWIANAARPSLARRDVVRGGALNEALSRWTRGAAIDSAHVQLDTAPDAASLAWLAALRGAGVGISWAGPAIADLALETYPPGDPAGGVIVATSARPSATQVLSDALGPLDTLTGGPAVVRLASVEGGITATSGAQRAHVEATPPLATRRVFVSGAAGWEAKFVVSALEERGWLVDAHLFVGPGRDVLQGARAGLDTSRYAAAVLLDSAAAEGARGVESFARSGGGVVLAGDASLASRVSGVIGWRAGERETAPLGTRAGDTAWRGLSRLPLGSVGDRRALTIESRSGSATVAARRHHAGRIVGVGYDQTWRWRMAGGEESVAAHREWWSRIVASVAARRATAGADSITSGAAPLAMLHARLGPPSQSVRSLPGALSRGSLSSLLGVLVLTALLAEWLLRRTRGAR